MVSSSSSSSWLWWSSSSSSVLLTAVVPHVILLYTVFILFLLRLIKRSPRHRNLDNGREDNDDEDSPSSAVAPKIILLEYHSPFWILLLLTGVLHSVTFSAHIIIQSHYTQLTPSVLAVVALFAVGGVHSAVERKTIGHLWLLSLTIYWLSVVGVKVYTAPIPLILPSSSSFSWLDYVGLESLSSQLKANLFFQVDTGLCVCGLLLAGLVTASLVKIVRNKRRRRSRYSRNRGSSSVRWSRHGKERHSGDARNKTPEWTYANDDGDEEEEEEVDEDGEDGEGHEWGVVYAHEQSPLLSRLTFFWFTRLLRLGYHVPLESEHLGTLPHRHTTSYQRGRFGSQDKDAKKGELTWSRLWAAVGSNMTLAGVFRLLADMAGFVPPLGIKTIVKWSGRNRTSPSSILPGLEGEEAFFNETMVTPLGDDSLPFTVLNYIENGYIMVGLVLLASILQATFSQCSTYLVNTEGLHVKVALQGMIYEKSLRVVGRGEETVVNLVGEDANNVMMLFWMAHFCWAIPLKLLILVYLLWTTLGMSALIAAAACILVMIPLQFLIAKVMTANSKLMLANSDERLGWTGEIVSNMRLIKSHAWEVFFGARLGNIREKELKHLDNDLVYRSIMTFLTHISTVMVTVITFCLYPVLEETNMEPSAVFAGLALFNQMTVPLFIFPILIPIIIDALVSGRRIREFLSLPELDLRQSDVNNKSKHREQGHNGGGGSGKIQEKSPINTTSPFYNISSDSVFVLANIEEEQQMRGSEDEGEDEDNILPVATPLLEEDKRATKDAPSPILLHVVKASFSWDDKGAVPALSDVNLEIRKGRLTVVVGPTGSGKSTLLLSSILGELNRTGGNVTWTSEINHMMIGYVPQSPWIVNGTVRENILFGSGFKGRRYKRVVEAVGLGQDLEILPDGDSTVVGDHVGINLSGGQKQRIAIARALYSTAPLLVLDDPLSALDVKVAAHVLEYGIRKMSAKRTVLLITHHLPALHHADHIVAMEGGKIRIQGTLAEIEERDPALTLHWRELISKKEAELAKHVEPKSGKEWWTLLKLVSKIGLRVGKNKPFSGVEDRRGLQHFRSRKGTISTYKTLSHDVFLPGDEGFHDDLLFSPVFAGSSSSRVLATGSSGTSTSRGSRASASSSGRQSQQQPYGSSTRRGGRVKLQRMSSLQASQQGVGNSGGNSKRGAENLNFSRLQSLPAGDHGDKYDRPSQGDPQSQSSSPRRIRSEANKVHYNNLNYRRRSGGPATPSSPQPLLRRAFNLRHHSKPTYGDSNSSLTEPSSPKLQVRDQIQPQSLTSVQSETEVTEAGSQEREGLLGGPTFVEEREYGRVPVRLYLIYMRACGSFLSLAYLIFAIGYEVSRVLTTFWLSRWSDASSDVPQNEGDMLSHYLRGYVLLSVVTVGISLTCNLLGRAAGASSREIMHNKFVKSLIAAPLSFFESTPIGHILGRASADVAVIDRKLVISVQRFLQFVFLCFSAVVVNGVVNPWFLILALPLVAIYYMIQRFYRVSSRELQRLQAISRGPFLSHFHETLQGLSTIRAYGKEETFTKHMFTCIDLNNRVDMFINVGNRWLSISLDYLGSVIVAVASIGAVVSADLALVTPSIVGLAINYTLLVPVYLNWVVKFLAEVEMFMNSVDRLDRYSCLEVENADEGTPLPPSWPSVGAVEFKDVTVSYQECKILPSFSLSIPGGQKVGICGRSGCGKSTLLSSLFRLSGQVEGRILVDGIDILRAPLRPLRASFCIIPQHSVLFSAPLRFNLDPAGKCDDLQMWEALESVKMKDMVFQLPRQLDEVMSPDSLSAGQRQLIALAVAILHKSKIVVMDEATSSVDDDMEQVILGVVAKEFKESTVLSIAHRLGTIVDGDRVIVLEEGKIVEDGAPSQLLGRRSRSKFAQMLQTENP